MATVPSTTYTQLSGVQQALYNDLRTTFAYEIQNKQLTITPDLKITLLGEPLLFQAGEYKLTHTQKQFLQNFFPKLLRVMKRYEKDIALLECNGHTSHEWRNTNFTNRYLNNQELSMKRAFSVLQFLFLHQPKQMQQWLSTILKGSGDGYRKTGEPLLDNTQRTQRHVRFQINLKSP
jgi:outer membrane protein OmpA-like peptidoglycan-associated protein